MEKTKENALMNCSNLDELLNVEFGAVGTPVRDEFDKETDANSTEAVPRTRDAIIDYLNEFGQGGKYESKSNS